MPRLIRDWYITRQDWIDQEADNIYEEFRTQREMLDRFRSPEIPAGSIASVVEGEDGEDGEVRIIAHKASNHQIVGGTRSGGGEW